MSNQDNQDNQDSQDSQDNSKEDAQRNKSEQRAMWIFSAAIVLLILGAMGANMMFHKETPAGGTDISSQSRTSPDK